MPCRITPCSKTVPDNSGPAPAAACSCSTTGNGKPCWTTRAVGRITYVSLPRHLTVASGWRPTDKAFCACAEGELTRIDRSDGLISDNIRSLLIEPTSDGLVMWVGSEDRGLQRLAFSEGQTRPDSMIAIQQRDGLFDNVIHVILPDRQGRLWMNSNRGIFWVERNELEDFIAGRVDRVQSIAYGPDDGLINREGNGGIQPAGAVDANGVLWLPTQAGLVEIDPARIARNQRPARPVIETVSVDDVAQAAHGNNTLALARDERDFRIRYTGISLSDPEGVQFRYRLAGYDREWRSTTSVKQPTPTSRPVSTASSYTRPMAMACGAVNRSA